MSYRNAVVAAVLAAPTETTTVRVVPDPADRRCDLFILRQRICGEWREMHSVCRYEDDHLSSLVVPHGAPAHA